MRTLTNLSCLNQDKERKDTAMKHVLVSLLVHREKKLLSFFFLLIHCKCNPLPACKFAFSISQDDTANLYDPNPQVEVRTNRNKASFHSSAKSRAYNLVVALSLSSKPASHFAINTEGVHTSSQEGESRQPGVHTWGNEHFTGSFNLCNPTCTLSPCCLAVTLWYSACRQFRHWLENQGAALARHPLN